MRGGQRGEGGRRGGGAKLKGGELGRRGVRIEEGGKGKAWGGGEFGWGARGRGGMVGRPQGGKIGGGCVRKESAKRSGRGQRKEKYEAEG